jgi:hypothetical protein
MVAQVAADEPETVPKMAQDLAHPDEERQRGQRPRRARAPEGLEQVHVGRRIGEELQPEPRHRAQGEGDPDAAGQQQQEKHQQDDACC